MQTYDYNSSTRNLKKVFTFFIFYSIILLWIVGDDRMKHIYTSIDIGSDAIKIVVAELYQNKINLLASTSTTSKGIKKGLIVDFDQALESVRNALNDIESMLGLKILDAVTSIIISLFILKVAIDIFRDSINKMIDKSCSIETINKYKKIIKRVKGVKRIDLIKSRLFGNKIYLDIEISVDGNLKLTEAHRISEIVHDKLEEKDKDIKHCMIHVNPYEK